MERGNSDTGETERAPNAAVNNKRGKNKEDKRRGERRLAAIFLLITPLNVTIVDNTRYKMGNLHLLRSSRELMPGRSPGRGRLLFPDVPPKKNLVHVCGLRRAAGQITTCCNR